MSDPLLIIRTASTPRGEIAACGAIDLDTGECVVRAAAVPLDGGVGRFGRRLGRIARKVARAKVVRRVSSTAKALGRSYLGMQRPRGEALERIAETARRTGLTEARDAARALTRTGRSLDRELQRNPEDPQLLAEAEQLEDIEDDLVETWHDDFTDGGFGDAW